MEWKDNERRRGGEKTVTVMKEKGEKQWEKGKKIKGESDRRGEKNKHEISRYEQKGAVISGKGKTNEVRLGYKTKRRKWAKCERRELESLYTDNEC